MPSEPDRKNDPIDYMRWQFLHAPGVPAHIRKSADEVDALCVRFAAEIERGEKIWSDEDRDWVSNPALK